MKNKNFLHKIIVIAFCFIISSCASISQEQMRKDTANFVLPKMPDKTSAVIYVVRPSMVGTIVRFNVFLDDKNSNSEIGHNRGNEYIYFKVTPGEHTIFSKAENWAEIKVKAEAGKTYFIKQTPGAGFVMARNSLSLLDEIQGVYEVRHAMVGTIK